MYDNITHELTQVTHHARSRGLFGGLSREEKQKMMEAEEAEAKAQGIGIYQYWAQKRDNYPYPKTMVGNLITGFHQAAEDGAHQYSLVSISEDVIQELVDLGFQVVGRQHGVWTRDTYLDCDQVTITWMDGVKGL